MIKPTYHEPRSMVRRAKKDSPSVETTIPEKIAHVMRLHPSNILEWMWVTEGLESYCKVLKPTA